MGEANVQLDSTIASLVPSQWEDIRGKLESMQTDQEKQFRNDVDRGIGKASPLNKIRLFDESNTENDVRVVFYRDHASWCPCEFLVCYTFLSGFVYPCIPTNILVSYIVCRLSQGVDVSRGEAHTLPRGEDQHAMLR